LGDERLVHGTQVRLILIRLSHHPGDEIGLDVVDGTLL